jgi:tetratricopeptide (TPR) repeat protein
VRAQVQASVKQALDASPEATAAKQEICQFYKDHQPNDPNHDLSQYVSLALSLGGAPDFKPKVKEADLPPDAGYVLGFVPLLAKFYKAANLHQDWMQVQPHYQSLLDSFNEPLSKMILQTDIYLKNPLSGYVGREFVIYIEPMAGPGQINARNYGDNYYLVASPVNGQLPMRQVRHTYLHFVLDPLAVHHPTAMKRLEPLLKYVQNAPMEESFKSDISLLVTESLIRAVEARMIAGGAAADPDRQNVVTQDMANGFVLTRFFYDQLSKYEQDPASLKDAFPDFLYNLDVAHEMKVAAGIGFSSNGEAEVVKGKIREQQDPLDLAQQKLAHSDLEGAQKLASQVADQKGPDAPRAYLILGLIATMSKEEDAAVHDFEETLRTAKEPHLIAWSHIYLGRIYDVDQRREEAVKQYQAALQAGDDTPQTIAAAKKGLESPYQRRASSEQDQ